LDIFKQHPEINTRDIPFFKYIYKNGKISIFLSLCSNIISYVCLLLKKGKRYKRVKKIIQDYQPKLIICDLEPYSAVTANDLSIPLVAIDHQHSLIESKIPGLSLRNRILIKFCRLIMKKIFKPDKIIATSFYHFPKRTDSKAVFVGPIIRNG